MLSPDIITGYHAHVYFDADTSGEKQAASLRDEAQKYFTEQITDEDVYIGRFHRQPVGPHTTGSFMIGFKPAVFRAVMQYLQLNAVGLNILIHPESGDDLKDHRDYPFWFGTPQKIDFLKL